MILPIYLKRLKGAAKITCGTGALVPVAGSSNRQNSKSYTPPSDEVNLVEKFGEAGKPSRAIPLRSACSFSLC